MLYAKAPAALDPIFLDDWALADNDIARMRVVIDQIASLTDPGAYALHAHLQG
jgi:dGTPase